MFITTADETLVNCIPDLYLIYKTKEGEGDLV